ncbi:MAG: cytochrome-c peroxidase [Crocinitomicaceae bacterium]
MRSIALLCLIFSFINLRAADKPSKIIQQEFKQNYDTLIQMAEKLEAYCVSNSNQEDQNWNWDLCKSHFFKTRLAYKKVSIFLDYIDRQFVGDFINGAPLPKIERKAPNLVVLDPKGLQIMEEKLVEQDEHAFEKLAQLLAAKLKVLKPSIDRVNISERMVYEAMRESLVSLAAQGITGFDTPSGENTATECEVVLSVLEETISYYYPYLTEDEKYEFVSIFEKGRKFFEINDFEHFDRFNFIKDCINPLYKISILVQRRLNIETRSLTSNARTSINENALNIFDTDFLDYRYYSAYSNSGDSAARVELGKLLFFDPLMSGNNQRACASCHHPNKAFTDGLKTSLAFNKTGHINRNAPGLINAVYNSRFFWDARATQPEDQVEHVIFNAHEFNTNYDEIVAKIKSCDEYVEKFESAYPGLKKGRSPLIGRYTIVASLSAYLQTLRSFNSNFDKEMKSETATSDQQLVNGFNVFTGKGACATCHFTPTFAGNVPPLYHETETEVIAIPDNSDQSVAQLDDDKGRYVNGRPKEKAPHYEFSFKTPTLRNIALTAPYMHNGVFKTLEEVVAFYNVGGGHGWGIAPENTTLPPDSLNLTDAEQRSLIYFMRSLTDTAGMTNIPNKLPSSSRADLAGRPIGGAY